MDERDYRAARTSTLHSAGGVCPEPAALEYGGVFRSGFRRASPVKQLAEQLDYSAAPKRASLMLLSGVMLAVAACAQLPDIPEGVCGNFIVEPGEDCDGFSDDGTCGASNSAEACRFVCTKDEEETASRCPRGYGCGADGICRVSTGRLTRQARAPIEVPYAMQMADLNADGYDDLLVSGPWGTSVSYFDEGATLNHEVPLPAGAGIPSVGQLTPDEYPDLALAQWFLSGIGVMQSQADGSLVSTAYAPYSSEGRTWLIAADATPLLDGVRNYGDELLVFTENQLIEATTDTVILQMPGDVSDLVGEVGVGNFDETLPCEQLALTFAGRSQVDLVSPCGVGLLGTEYNHAADDPTYAPVVTFEPVTLANDDVVNQGVLVVSLNDDSFPDLVISGQNNLHAAFGVGGGRFHSDEAFPPSAEDSDNTTSVLPLEDGELPLAVGDLNGDQSVDVVHPAGILLSDSLLGADAIPFVIPNTGPDWTHAHIADFNGDGLPDVATASRSTAQVQIYVANEMGQLSSNDVQIGGNPTHVAFSDFDANGIADIVYSHAADQPNRELLKVLFGQAHAPPVAGESLGKLQRVDQMVVTNIDVLGDGNSDLVVSTIPDDDDGDLARDIALFIASTNQQFESPFNLTEPGSNTEDFQPVAVSVGAFTGDGHDDIAVLSVSPSATFRLWMVPVTGEAEIHAVDVRYKDFPERFIGLGTRSVTMDLDDDGREELVVLGPYQGEEHLGAVLIARWDDDDVVIESTTPTSDGYWHDTLGWGSLDGLVTDDTPPGPGDMSDIEVMDVDGDGHLDLLTLGVSSEGERCLLVMRGNAQGGLDVEGRRRLCEVSGLSDEDSEPRAFAALQLDATPTPELVVITSTSVVTASIDLDEERLTLLSRLGDSTDILAVTTGDADGDGVDDVLLGSSRYVDVWVGVPLLD